MSHQWTMSRWPEPRTPRLLAALARPRKLAPQNPAPRFLAPRGTAHQRNPGTLRNPAPYGTRRSRCARRIRCAESAAGRRGRGTRTPAAPIGRRAGPAPAALATPAVPTPPRAGSFQASAPALRSLLRRAALPRGLSMPGAVPRPRLAVRERLRRWPRALVPASMPERCRATASYLSSAPEGGLGLGP
jgi:hypothetical protein